MEYVKLGKTGLSVSKIGLGCGGHSKLGQSYGAKEKDSIELVRAAIELGINYIDTARAYGTEPIVGKAIAKTARSSLTLSSKVGLGALRKSESPTEEAVMAEVDTSLRNLETDYIDVYHVHGLRSQEIDFCIEEVMPSLRKAQEAGKIRYLAVSEAFGQDTRHEMFEKLEKMGAIDLFDVAMVGFNVLNPSARSRALPSLVKHGLGSEIMFAIRRALTSADRFREAVSELIEMGDLEESIFDGKDPAEVVFGTKKDAKIREIAYRFASYEPGADVTLVGTGRIDHLEENVAAILQGPLDAERKAAIDEVFGSLSSLSGN